MSYITASQLFGAHAIAAKAIAHFQQTGDSAHPDTNTTFFPAPNHRIRNNSNNNSNNERPVERGVAAVNNIALVKKTALNAAAAEFAPATALNAAAEFAPVLDAATADFELAAAIARFAANAVATPITEIRSLWDNSTNVEVASHPTALFAPIAPVNQEFNIRSLWDDSAYIEAPSHPTALFAPIVAGAYLWPCGPFTENATTPTPITAPRPVRPLAALIRQLTNAAASRRSSISSKVSASETVFDNDTALEISSPTTTATETTKATDAFRQLSEYDLAQTALEYGIDLEDLEMQGRELVGWERLIEEEL